MYTFDKLSPLLYHGGTAKSEGERILARKGSKYRREMRKRRGLDALTPKARKARVSVSHGNPRRRDAEPTHEGPPDPLSSERAGADMQGDHPDA